MTRRPLLRAALTTAVPALAAGVVLAATGVLDPVHAALLVVVVATTTHLWRTLDDGVEPPWPDPPEDRRDGARSDVSELGWATFTRSGQVGDRMLRRVRELATARLAEHGVDLATLDDTDATDDTDAAARLLGADVVAGLTARRPVGRAEVHRWLDAIEALAPPATGHPAASAPRPHSPTTTTPTPPVPHTAGRHRP